MYDPSLTHTHCTFILTKSKELTRTNCTFGVERAIKQKVPLKLVMAPVNQRTIGEMELVPSAVGPNPIEQRYKIVKVRTPRRWSGVQRRGGVLFSSPLGAVIDKRPAPEASCPPAAQAKKTIDLVDIKSASVSAQAAGRIPNS